MKKNIKELNFLLETLPNNQIVEVRNVQKINKTLFISIPKSIEKILKIEKGQQCVILKNEENPNGFYICPLKNYESNTIKKERVYKLMGESILEGKTKIQLFYGLEKELIKLYLKRFRKQNPIPITIRWYNQQQDEVMMGDGYWGKVVSTRIDQYCKMLKSYPFAIESIEIEIKTLLRWGKIMIPELLKKLINEEEKVKKIKETLHKEGWHYSLPLSEYSGGRIQESPELKEQRRWIEKILFYFDRFWMIEEEIYPYISSSDFPSMFPQESEGWYYLRNIIKEIRELEQDIDRELKSRGHLLSLLEDKKPIKKGLYFKIFE